MEVLYFQIWYLYSSISSLTSGSEVCGNPPPSQPAHVSTTAFFLARGEFRSHWMCPSGIPLPLLQIWFDPVRLCLQYRPNDAPNPSLIRCCSQFSTCFPYSMSFSNLQNAFREVSQKSRFVAFLIYISHGTCSLLRLTLYSSVFIQCFKKIVSIQHTRTEVALIQAVLK